MNEDRIKHYNKADFLKSGLFFIFLLIIYIFFFNEIKGYFNLFTALFLFLLLLGFIGTLILKTAKKRKLEFEIELYTPIIAGLVISLLFVEELGWREVVISFSGLLFYFLLLMSKYKHLYEK